MKHVFWSIVLLFFYSTMYAQDISQKVSMRLQNVTMKEFFNRIETQTSFSVVYRDVILSEKPDITLSASNRPLKDVLEEVLQKQGLSYKISNKTIVIIKAPARATTKQTAKDITGVVTDESGLPVIGANIMVKGTSNGTITDEAGHFSLSVGSKSILQVTYLGYEQQSIPVNNQNHYIIVLKENTQQLNEVVVVGYGVVKKRDLTGSVSSVNAEQITAVPAVSVQETMQGRIPGVLVSTNNWSPGSSPSVLIRGKRSITASNDPLYVVDGIPITGGIGEISPGDIESIDVLKDASATAIYGSRGANGVILVTTKQGQEGKTKIDYNGYVGAQTIQNQLNLMNGAEFAEYVRESFRNTTNQTYRYLSDFPNRDEDMINRTFIIDPYVLESVLQGYDDKGNYDPSRVRSMDWRDYVTRTGLVTDHQLSIRGGNRKTNFLVSLAYNKNNGIYKDEDYERYSIRSSINHEINKYVKFGIQASYSHSLKHRGSGLNGFWKISPLGHLFEEDGSLSQMVDGANIWNPLLNLQEGVFDRPLKTTRYLGNYFVEIKLPLDGLRFRSNVGLDSRNVQNQEFFSGKTASRQNGSSIASSRMEKYSMFTLENLLYYDKVFKQDHSLGVTLLQSIQEDKSENLNANVEDLPGDVLKYYNLGSALIISGLGSGYSKWSMASFMGRVNYSYKGKYLLTASARYDGSSRLAEGHKWVLFPSLALAWRMSDENFMRSLHWIDNLKWRVGYGKTGNSAVSPYQTLGGLSTIKYPFDNGKVEMIGYAPKVMANHQLTWETTDQWNFGLDLTVLNGRLNLTADYYIQNTYDLLLDRQLPIVSGFSQILSNVGETRNKGIEMNITSTNIQTRNFKWNTTLMLYRNKEEIVSLYNEKEDDKGNKWFIGHPIDVHYDYRKVGIWQDTPEDRAEMEKFQANGSNFTPGSIKLEDVNKDYKISDEDKVILGTPRPKLITSMINDFKYKDFDLSVFMYASIGSMLYNNMNILEHSGRLNSVKVDYWTPSNPTNAYPRPSIDFERPPYISAINHEKTSYLRVKTITLGYTLPQSLSKKFMTNRLRFYFTAENPFIFTNYTGVDPEGATGNTNPSVSSWIFGINLSL